MTRRAGQEAKAAALPLAAMYLYVTPRIPPIDPADVLGAARSFADLSRIVADHCEHIGMSRATLDAEAFIGSGHAAKALARRARKKLGWTTLGRVMEAVGVLIYVARDPAAKIPGSSVGSRNGSSRDHHWRNVKGPTWGRRMAAMRNSNCLPNAAPRLPATPPRFVTDMPATAPAPRRSRARRQRQPRQHVRSIPPPTNPRQCRPRTGTDRASSVCLSSTTAAAKPGFQLPCDIFQHALRHPPRPFQHPSNTPCDMPCDILRHTSHTPPIPPYVARGAETTRTSVLSKRPVLRHGLRVASPRGKALAHKTTSNRHDQQQRRQYGLSCRRCSNDSAMGFSSFIPNVG